MTMHGRRLRRFTALLTGGALVGGALLAAPIGAAAPAAAADGTTITPNPAYAGEAFEGWGTSLVWFANATGGYPEELREQLYQAVFGEDGLDLNIARYNIGGGNASDVQDYLRPGGAVDGWWAADADGSAGTYDGTTTKYADRNALLAKWDAEDPASYDWSADETQRWWVERLAADDQITHWETFANSAPYFMTESGYVSGGFNASSEQLKPAAEAQFASYLVRVTEHLEDEYGIDVDTIDPFNEPNTNYWGTTLSNGKPVGGRQEGMHMGPARQVSLVDDVRAELDDPATTTDAGLAAMDETNPGIFATNWAGYPAATRAKVDRMNVHTYGTSGRLVVRDLAKQADTDLWMSEIEGNWVNGFNPVNIENGLGIAGRIQDDLRELEPNAWVLWQPVEDLYNMEPQGENLNWGSIFIDLDCKPYEEAGGTVWKSERRVDDAGGDSTGVEACGVQVNSKFNTIRNFTKFIHEGDHLVAIDDVSSTAAIRGDGTGATIVHRNTAASERQVTIDLSRFGDIAEGATVTPVVTTQADSADAPTANALVEGTPVAIDRAARTATLTVPAKSVTTFVIDGVSGVAADAPALRDGHRYQLVGTQSGKAFTAGTSGAATTIRNLATSATAAAPQAWTVHEVGAGDREATRRVVLEASDGRVLGATGSGTDLRTVGVEAAAGDAATRWIVNTTDGRAYTLVNEALGLSLDVGGQSTADGATVGVYGSNGGANQSWDPRDLAPLEGQTVAARTQAGVVPVLPETVVPRYAWGAGVPVAVTWQLPDEGAWAQTGRVEVPGTATDVFGQAIGVTALVDVGGLTATDPVSITVAEGASLTGVQAAAPAVVPARVGASENAFDVPVTWDWSGITDAAFDEVGVVQVPGAASADGASLAAQPRGARDRGDAAQLQPRRRHQRLGEFDRVGLPRRSHAQRRAGRQGLVELGVDEQAGAEHADLPLRGAAPGGARLGAVLPRRHHQLGADDAGAGARHRRRLGRGARLGDRAARGLAGRRQRADGRGRLRARHGDGRAGDHERLPEHAPHRVGGRGVRGRGRARRGGRPRGAATRRRGDRRVRPGAPRLRDRRRRRPSARGRCHRGRLGGDGAASPRRRRGTGVSRRSS